MHKTISFSIRGIAPLLCHNGQLANPLNSFARRMQQLNLANKKTKTEANFEEIARTEWMGSLYLNADGVPCVPGLSIESAIVEGARKFKLGKKFQSGVFSECDWPIRYDGPKSIDELWENTAFRDQRMVRVTTSRVLRTRPIFRSWQLDFDVAYLPDIVTRQQIIDVVAAVGRIVGLGDYRPRFGRFEIETHT